MLTIITNDGQHELQRRFPAIADTYRTRLMTVGEFGPAITFANDSNFFRVENVLLANALEGMVRVRHIRLSLIITKQTTTQEYSAFLRKLLDIQDGSNLVGMELVPSGEAEVVLGAAQFANIFLMNKLHETSIGAFIDSHREILLSALEAQNLISQPELPWVTVSPDPSEHAIIPDLFVQRADRYWDVYDLKLALLDRREITTGPRRRRRFVYTVEDGMAQLAHYRDFLAIPQHAQWANERYGVTFSDPRFVLVVGNYENIDVEKVAEARRRFPDLELIDYDSLLQLYLMHQGAMPTDEPADSRLRAPSTLSTWHSGRMKTELAMPPRRQLSRTIRVSASLTPSQSRFQTGMSSAPLIRLQGADERAAAARSNSRAASRVIGRPPSPSLKSGLQRFGPAALASLLSLDCHEPP
jgi:hypothetical protein